MEDVESVLLVPAGVEDGRRAGQLQESINDTLVFIQRPRQRFPHLLGLVRILHHWLMLWHCVCVCVWGGGGGGGDFNLECTVRH